MLTLRIPVAEHAKPRKIAILTLPSMSRTPAASWPCCAAPSATVSTRQPDIRVGPVRRHDD